ncbi:MAG TPA: hypothetical protein VMJ10_12965 [Kofleriaceae bacterium]|nr:hypothetical protein [Kofleriaceae bacterium]
MRRTVVVVTVLFCSWIAAAQVAPPPPPPLPLPPGLPEPPPPLRFVRLEFLYEQMSPQGALSANNRLGDTPGVGVNVGFNISEFVALDMDFGGALTTSDNQNKDFLYFDLISVGPRVQFELAPRIAIFGEGTVGLTGISTVCSGSNDTGCTGSGDTSFQPRLGLHARAGATFALVPRQIEVVVSAGQSWTVPDEGAWFQLMAGLIFELGMHPRDMARMAGPMGTPMMMK